VSSPITPVGADRIPLVIEALGERRRSGGFERVFQETIRQVEDYRQSADKSVEAQLVGQGEELHQTILATQRAELAFELFLQVRNKVVQAYQEIMRMQM